MKSVQGQIGGSVSTLVKASAVRKAQRVFRTSRTRQLQILSLAAAGIIGLGKSAHAADTVDSVNLNATAALDTAANYSLNALPTATNDMVFLNGVYTNTAFTLNTTALTPGTLDDLDTFQTLSISGTKSITLKTLANGVLGTAPADLLYVSNGSNLNISNAVILGVSGGNFDVVGNANLSGNINGSTATYTLAKSGAGTLSLSAAESYTGATTLVGGNLNLNFAGTGAPTTNILTGTDPMTWQNGMFTVTGSASGANSQSLGAVTLNNAGFVTVNVVPGATGTAALTLASLTRTANTNSDATGGGVQFNKTGTITITGTTSSAILLDSQSNPYATYGLDDWAATNSNGQVIAAVAGTAYTDFTATTSINGVSPSAVRLSNTGTPITITNANTSTLRGILVTSESAGGTITGGFVRANRASGATAGSQFLVVENAPANATPGGTGDLTIASSISTASSSTPVALVKAGPGRLILSSTANAQNRDFIDGGILSVAADLDLGTAGGDLVFDGGTLEVTGTFTPGTARANILTNNSGISVTGSNVFTDQGLLSGQGSMTKSGSGTLTLTDANAFAGGTTVTGGTLDINGFYALGGGVYGGLTLNGGTLQYATNTAGANNGGADVSFFGNGLTVGSSGGGIDLNGNPVTFAGTLHDGGGALAISSSDSSHAGVLTLSGNSTLAAGIAINSGTLSVTGALASTPVTVNSGATLMGTGSVGTINLSGGLVTPGVASPFINQFSTNALTYSSGTFQFGIGTSTAGNISTGSATFNGKPSFNFLLSGSPASGSVYTLLTSTTPIVDNANLTNLTPTTIGRLTLTPSESGTNSIIVTLTGNAANLVYDNGAGTGLFNIQTDKNFLNTGTSANDFYYEGDNVTFNDSNGGAGNYTVGIAQTVNPGSVTVNNSAGNYVFNGPGTIAGGTSLVKSGTGSLTLNNTNTYSGGTIISRGSILIGTTNALPTAGSVTVQGTSTLDLNGNNQTIGGLSDGGVATGIVTSSSGNPILTLNSTAAANAFSGTVTGSVGINKTGTSTFTLSGNNTYTGLTNISNGTLVVANNSALGNSTSSVGGLYTTATGLVNFTTSAPAIASLAGTGGTVTLAGTSGTTLTVGGGNATTTFAGVLADASATTSTAVGNLAVIGSGNLTLSGADTFTGVTTINGSSTLTLNNAAALQDSTLNYNNQGGTLSFGTLTAATLAGLTGTENLNLSNTAGTAVTLSIGNNNVSSTYSGALTGNGSIVKLGTGNLILSGSSTYTGATSISNTGSTLTITGSLTGGGMAYVNPGGTLNISGGTLLASGLNVNQNGGASNVNIINNGSLNASNGTITLGYDSGASGQTTNVLSGTLIANVLNVGRDGSAATGLMTTEPNAGGLNVNGSNAVVTVNTLGIGVFTNANSDSVVQLENGTINVSGTTTISQNNNRTSLLDIAGGTFNSSNGVQIGGVYTAPVAEFLVHGGVANVSGITFGTSVTTGGTNALELGGGTLYVGSGGLVSGTTAITPTVNLGAVAFATAPTLAASAAWSSSLAMTLTNSSAGVAPTIQTADSTGTAQNITLTGNLSGTGGLIKTGAGLLTISSSNYSGATVVTAGTLTAGAVNSLSANSAFNISSGVLDASAFNNSIASLTVGSGGTLNLAYGNVLTTAGAASLAGTLNLSGTAGTLPENLLTYSSETGTFTTVTGVPTGDMLTYTATSLELTVVSSGPANLTFNNAGGTGDGTTFNTSQQNFNNGTGVVAFNTGDNVTFNDVNNGNYNVSIPAVVAPGSTVINNSAATYNFNGSGGIGGSGALTKLGTASAVVFTSNSYTGGTNVSAGTLALANAHALPALTNLNVSSGALLVARTLGSAYALSVNTLSDAGKINLNNNALIVHSGSLSAVRALVQSGYNNGTWNNSTGIISLSASTDPSHLTALGVILNDNGSGTALYGSGGAIASTFAGATPVDGDVLVKYTYYGDANLDGKVDGTDYSRIDAAFLADKTNANAATGWYNGDFNYDGVIDGSDYTLIDNAFNQQSAVIAADIASPSAAVLAQIAPGASAVPEPTTLGLLGIGALGLLGRRSRRR